MSLFLNDFRYELGIKNSIMDVNGIIIIGMTVLSVKMTSPAREYKMC